MSAAQVLKDLYTTREVTTRSGETVPIHSALSPTSTAKLTQLARDCKAKDSVEVGFAFGVSTLAILTALEEQGGGRHVVCDPFQTEDFGGGGLNNIERAGHADTLEFYQESSCIVLPRLVTEGRKFDLAYIDGYHSFDYTFIDYFYADLLLREGGVMAIDDWGMPQVYHVVEFLRTHKAYELLGPRELSNPLSFSYKWRQKRRKLAAGEDREWGSICAFRKVRDLQVPWSFFESTFYPGYALYRNWMRLRGIKPVSPLDGKLNLRR